MEDKGFRSIHIDLEKGIYEINGESLVGKQITKLELEFNGCWELTKKYTLIGSAKSDGR